MSIKLGMQINGSFKRKVKARFERYTAQVGILNNAPYKRPLPASQGLARVAGGPARKTSTRDSGQTLADVGEHIRKDLGIPYLTAPFEHPGSREAKAVVRELGSLITGQAKSYSKFETALRRLIRQPILDQKYGRNIAAREKVKRFNRLLIDTGQFFKAIIAKVKVK